jgi:hypothetical protein
MSQVVIVAFGCEIRDFHYNTKAVKLLNDRAKVKKPDVWLFQDKAKGLDFEIRVVYTKAEFAAALDLDEAIVVYNGHSRFGQGPAFGPAHLSHCPDVQAFPVNPWEDHYRMGYDAIEIPCIEDIFEHCTNPTEIAKGKPKADLFVAAHVRRLLDRALRKGAGCQTAGARRSLLKCFPKVASQTNGRGVQSLKTRDFWFTTDKDTEFHTIVNVGSKDLATATLKCKLLFMNSCSSKVHFYRALKRRKREAKSRCAFYMTHEVCPGDTTTIFLRLLMDGHDPLTRKGKRKFVKEMNGDPGAGNVEFLL